MMMFISESSYRLVVGLIAPGHEICSSGTSQVPYVFAERKENKVLRRTRVDIREEKYSMSELNITSRNREIEPSESHHSERKFSESRAPIKRREPWK